MKRANWSQSSLIFFPSRFAIACAVLLSLKTLPALAPARGSSLQEVPGQPGEPYPNMPAIAPLGVRIGKHLPVPESAEGPAIHPAKGYRVQDLGQGLYMVTDNGYQSLFMVYPIGVVVVDAPLSYAQYIPKAIAEITDKPITHLIYSH
jgi:hypothetical protein